jgi:hypothetical protein
MPSGLLAGASLAHADACHDALAAFDYAHARQLAQARLAWTRLPTSWR